MRQKLFVKERIEENDEDSSSLDMTARGWQTDAYQTGNEIF